MEQGVCFFCSQIVAGDDLTLLADVDMAVVDGRITLIGKA